MSARFRRWKSSLLLSERTYSDGSYIPCQILKERFKAETTWNSPIISLGNCPTTSVEQEAKENTMNMNIAATNTAKPYSVEQDRVEHFTKVRLPRIASAKTDELAKHFNLVDDKRPKTWKELMKRVEEGRIVIDEERELAAEVNPDYFDYGCPLDSIRFRDPKAQPDQKGYQEAVKLMFEGMRETEDEIVAHQNDGEKILAAVGKFESKTFH